MNSIFYQAFSYPLVYEFILILFAYAFLLSTSGYIVNIALNYTEVKEGADDRSTREGFVIGKCENILVLTLVLAGQFTALALIFAAENIATRESQNGLFPSFVLVGTIVNFTYSLIISVIISASLSFV